MSKTVDTELFELCKKVYERTGWKDTPSNYHEIYLTKEIFIAPDVNWQINVEGPIMFICPLYTSDYLLEKLPREIQSETIELVAYGGHWEAAYSGARDDLWNQNIGSHAAETPLKALLKLTISLHDAGHLK